MSVEAVTAPGVRSEVGRLRTVLLHRPGNELKRLTPRNNDALLFDGLPWVDRAQEEHDGFAETLDFESPIGFPQVRQAQARYTTVLESGDSYSFSIEDPASAITGASKCQASVAPPSSDIRTLLRLASTLSSLP